MMKKILLFGLMLFSFQLFAQPMNDDCMGIIDLGIGINCDSTIYNSENATASQIFDPPSAANIPSCWDNVNNDVWFEFTVPADGSIVDFTVTIGGIGGNSITQPQLAVYRGECANNELDELLCAKADVGESEVVLDLEGLTPGLPYFLRVDDFSATATPNWGDFIVCVDTLQEVNTIDEGGSTSCSGELYDSGGPDENYGDGENFVYTICPPAPSNQCITYTLEYYNLDAGNDALNIYDGMDVNSIPIASLTDFNNQGNTAGGVCYVAQASSGCLTVEFISDGSVNFEGFSSNWVCSSQPCEQPNTISVETNVTGTQITDVIAAPEAVVTLDTIICPQGAYGLFEGDNTDLGLNRGILLTTGTATNAVGPNNDDGFNDDTLWGAPGDDDLDIISINYGDGTLSEDACILEVDVFAAGDELSFEYVFGSEEYPEFVNGINDVFAFLISGPGITGDPLLNNQLNIATIPGTNTPIEINSVNNLVNWEYYRDNLGGQSIEYDGLTSDFLGVKKSLTARADVIPCNTYHLKLAIADRSDDLLDSGVFIAEISGGRPEAALNSAVNLDYLIEGCSGGAEELTLFINEAQDNPTTFIINIGGTAQTNIDYTFPLSDGDTIVIPAGQTSISFPIIPLVDNIVEGTETIDISLTFNFGCGDVVYFETTIPLEDEPVVDINSGQDSAFVCANEGITLNVEGATTYFWTPVSVISDPSSPSPFATPPMDMYVNVIGNVGICTDEDSIYLQVVDPQITINPLTTTDVCEGTAISLEAVNNVINQGLVWTSDGGTLPDPNAPIISDTPPVTTTYTATVELEGCSDMATFTVNVDPFDFPNLTTTDTTLCESYTFMAAVPIPGTTTVYEWTPFVNMNDNTLPNPTITGTNGTQLYTLTATSENGYCSQMATVSVTGIPASAPIGNPDTIEICFGEMVDLSATTSTGGVGFQWLSDPFDPTLTPVTNTMLTVTPEISTTYYTELTVGACTVFDSTFVRVDSMPDLSVESVPFKDIYCIEDIVSIVTPTYNPASYPAIMHMWEPASSNSIQSDVENLNLVLIVDETTTYVRTTTNRGCLDTTSITIEVVDPILELTWYDTTVCAGEEIEISELIGDDNHFWTPEGGIASGQNSSTAILQPYVDTEFVVSATISECEAFDTAYVTVNQLPDVSITTSADSIAVLVGTEVTYTAVIENEVPGEQYQYIWTLNGQTVGGSESTLTVTIVEEGTNLVQVTVINEVGCEGISPNEPIIGFIPFYQTPNAFTPDGDGVNDFFNFTYMDKEAMGGNGPVEVLQFSVWNRWGNLVYDNENPETGWDGTIDGEAAPTDVYVYYIQIKYPNGTVVALPREGKKGDVTLIR